MPAPPTVAELHAALARIRTRPACAAWPADLAAVLADPVRGRLLRLEACRPSARPSAGTRPLHWRPALRALPAIDCKRAAAGERDD